MLITYPVVNAVNPGLQIGEGGMDHRKELVGNLRVAAFGDMHVRVPSVGEVVIAFPVIGNNKRTRHNRPFDEAAKRLCGAIRNDGETYAPRVPAVLPLVEFAARLALMHLNSTSDKAHVVYATAFAACTTADIGLVNLDVFVGFAADPVMVRANHAGSELVENLECRFITGKP